MDKETKEVGNKTKEGRLKIKEIKKLTFKNKALGLIKYSGLLTCLLVDFLAVLSVSQSGLSLFHILAVLYANYCAKNKFILGITTDQQYNNEEIVRLENEILNSKEKN